jgi:transcriptional regulator with XRE-family HTH domain
MEIGRQIILLRKSRRLTQEELATRCGIDQAMISRIESNQANFTMDTLAKILEALGYVIVFKAEEDECSQP